MKEVDVAIQSASLELLDSFYECLTSIISEKVFLARVAPPSFEAVKEFTQKAVDGEIIRLFAVQENIVVGSCDIIPSEREGFRHAGTLGIGVLGEHRG